MGTATHTGARYRCPGPTHPVPDCAYRVSWAPRCCLQYAHDHRSELGLEEEPIVPFVQGTESHYDPYLSPAPYTPLRSK